MHIKQFTISNFRSFKEQREIVPFAPTTNVVVGRNGSGKSNLFDAVQFVLLGPRFATLGLAERQALLHEGSGSAAVNAFVEVIFDNSDNRFSMENSDEVVLRRTVGSKKDEFFLQRKRATKQEVLSLLEGAGFSKSNPYFMVQQGKIQTLCTMTDAQRLQLLQQVAGTTLYEDKKKESLLKMQENQKSIDRINEILLGIEDRLKELQGETEELRAYQKLDRQRKTLEYTLYEKELLKARHALNELEKSRQEHAKQLQQRHDKLRSNHDAIQNAEAELRSKSQELRRNRTKLEHLEQDKTKAVTHREQCKWQVQELEEQVANGAETLRRSKKLLQRLETQISEAEQEQAALLPQYRAELTKLDQLLQTQDQAQHQIDALYAKQGRGKQYSSIQERDQVLRQQIGEIQTLQTEKEQALADQQATLGNLRRSSQSQLGEAESKKQEIAGKQNSLHGLGKALDDKQRQHAEIFEQRKNAWRKRQDLQERLQESKDALNRSLSDTRKAMPRATAMGLRHLDNIVQQERLVVGQQYFGMLVENMSLKDPAYRTAVEVAAQNSLFHVVVDTDATAARLMKRLEDERLGRVTFLPLNRLQVDDRVRYPDPEASMLQTCIEYDPKVERAMRHVFEKKLLARTPEVASEWAAQFRMDAITVEGDLCSRKGALTGGYTDPNKSRLRAYEQLRVSREQHVALNQEFRQTDVDAKQIEQDVTNMAAEVSRLEQRQTQLQRSLAGQQASYDQTIRQIEHDKKQTEKIETEVLPPLEREITAARDDIQRLQDEIGTDLVQTLSDEDRATLQRLKQEAAQNTKSIEEQRDTVDDLSVKRQKLQSLLQDNLLKQRQELTEVRRDAQGASQAAAATRITSAAAQEQLQRDLGLRQVRFQEASQSTTEIETQIGAARELERSLKAQLGGARSKLEKLKSDDMESTRLLEEATADSEKLLIKKSTNVEKRETYIRKIQELGSLPPTSALDEYKSESIPNLMSSLERVNKKLKKYSHVNKKAYDQFLNFSEQRESLFKRKDELDSGAAKVQELIENLDRKKDEAINGTFRGVSKHFKEVFKELVPLGGGELIMKTAMDGPSQDTDKEGDDEEDSEDKTKMLDAENPDVSLYKGVGIKVWFSDSGENFIMSQLSGGQKALVALALIFAIQRCDTAPFYIFDELDQALDSTYRQAVANLIQRQANDPENPAQFIMSTFRPELVSVAKNCYGISHQNKESKIDKMGKNEALKFIADMMTEEEAIGDAGAAPGTASGRKSRKRKSNVQASAARTAVAAMATAESLPQPAE